MKKRYIIFVFIISAIFISFFVFWDNEHINDLYINDKEYNSIIESHELSKDVEIDNIYFDGYKLFKTSDGTFYYSLIEDSKSRYNPTISTEDKSVNVKFYGEKIDDDLIKNNQSIKIIAYNSKNYNEYELICTTLPIMSISEIDAESTDENKGRIEIFDNDYSSLNRYIVKDCKINVRGHYSINDPKKNYSLTLTDNSLGYNERKSNVSIFGLKKDSDYILYASCEDETKIRNVFTSNLWQETCKTDNETKNYGFEYKYIELIINNEYYGLYAISNKIDVDYLGLDTADIIYKKRTGKYSDYTYNKDSLECLEEYRIKTKSTDDTIHPLDEYYRILLSTNESNIEELYSYFDIDNNIDYYLFINLIQGVDNWHNEEKATNNLYIIAKKEMNYYKYYLMPYDFDLTWDRDFNGNLYIEYNVDVEFSAAHLLYYLEDGFKEKMINRYFDLRSGCWSDESILSMISECENKIYDSGAYKRDKNRWPTEIYSKSKFADGDDASDFKKYVIERLHYLDEFYENI